MLLKLVLFLCILFDYRRVSQLYMIYILRPQERGSTEYYFWTTWREKGLWVDAVYCFQVHLSEACERCEDSTPEGLGNIKSVGWKRSVKSCVLWWDSQGYFWSAVWIIWPTNDVTNIHKSFGWRMVPHPYFKELGVRKHQLVKHTTLLKEALTPFDVLLQVWSLFRWDEALFLKVKGWMYFIYLWFDYWNNGNSSNVTTYTIHHSTVEGSCCAVWLEVALDYYPGRTQGTGSFQVQFYIFEIASTHSWFLSQNHLKGMVRQLLCPLKHSAIAPDNK